jgi:hypothetical protein
MRGRGCVCERTHETDAEEDGHGSQEGKADGVAVEEPFLQEGLWRGASEESRRREARRADVLIPFPTKTMARAAARPL